MSRAAAGLRSARVLAVVLAVVLMTAVVMASCGREDLPRPSATVEYSHALTEDLYLPAGTGTVPLVVLVPGGSWRTADPRGLAGLAAALARRGVAAAPARIRAAADGVRYPRPVEDVLCAVAAAVDGARARGFDPAPVAVLGHSSGAHLAALAVLADADPSPRCDSPPVTPDALIGLSGPYDITRTPDAARALLGSDPDEDPRAWAAANPVGRAGLRADVPVLLLHGGSDDVVPVSFTYQFAAALRGAGHPTTVEVVAGIDHQGIYRADVAGERVARWLLGLSGDGPTAPARRRRAGR